MNLLALAQRLKRESGRSGDQLGTLDSLNQDDQRLVDWLADAWRELEIEKLWTWQRVKVDGLVLVDGQAGYTPSDDFTLTDVRSWWPEGEGYFPLVYRDGAPETKHRLRWVAPEVFDQQYLRLPFQPGDPVHWTEMDGKLWIGPTPTGGWRLQADYRRTVQELADEADEPAMPAEFHLLLVWRALREVAVFDGAAEVQIRADNNLKPLRTDLEIRCAPRMRFEPRPW